jgi:hypothetical protein
MKFTIYNLETGEKLATFPLTVPIWEAVEAYQLTGYQVAWTWEAN